MSVFNNFPLMAAVISIVTAQFIKVPLKLISSRTFDVKLGFSTGGMPSSHSAAVTSLATAVGITEGFDSSLFAIAAVVCSITMYDAAGIRRHAGMHASFLNRISKIIHAMNQSPHESPASELKELLGHRPIEVFAGAVFGVGVSLLLRWLAYS